MLQRGVRYLSTHIVFLNWKPLGLIQFSQDSWFMIFIDNPSQGPLIRRQCCLKFFNHCIMENPSPDPLISHTHIYRIYCIPKFTLDIWICFYAASQNPVNLAPTELHPYHDNKITAGSYQTTELDTFPFPQCCSDLIRCCYPSIYCLHSS